MLSANAYSEYLSMKIGRELIMAGFSLSSGEWEVDYWPLVVRNRQYFSLDLFLTLTPTLNLFPTLALTLNLTPTLPLTLNLTSFTPHPALPTFHSPLPACTVVTNCSGVATVKESKNKVSH